MIGGRTSGARAALGTILLVALSASSALGQDDDGDGPARTTRGLAVLPFSGPGAAAGVEWLVSTLPELITADLEDGAALALVDHDVVRRALGGSAPPSTNADVAEIADKVGASAVLLGSVSAPDGTQATVTLKVVSGLTGRGVAGGSKQIDLADPMRGVRSLLASTLTSAGYSGVLETSLNKGATPDRAVLEDVYGARSLAQTDEAAARKRYERALRRDPASTLRFTDLRGRFDGIRPRLAVVDLAGPAGPAAWPASGLAELARVDLAALGFDVVDTRDLLLTTTGQMTDQAAITVGRELRADLAAVAAVKTVGRRIVVDIRVLNVAKDRLELVANGTNAEGDLLVATEAAFAQIARLYPLQGGGLPAATLVQSTTSDDLRKRLAADLAARRQSANALPDPASTTPRIVRFEASQPGPGQAASALSWTATGVDTCEIDGVGVVPPHGRRMITPDDSGIFVLRCTGRGQVVEASAEVTVSYAVPWRPFAFWGAWVGVGAGGAIALAGFVGASFPAATANQLHGMQLLVTDEDDLASLRAQRDQLALLANAGIVVGVTGAVVALASLGGIAAVELIGE